MKYHLVENTIDNADIDNLIEWLKTYPWLTMGPLVREFEHQYAAWTGTKYALMVNSGSSANLLMYYAAMMSGRMKNKKVIVPAVSWATTVAPAIQLGLEPILCDAESDTLGIDPIELERLVKEHDPAAVVIVHVLGVPCKMDEIVGMQQRYGFLLLEDACAAQGSMYDGCHVGTFGTMSTMSLFFGHMSSTIEGGIVCTNDDVLYDTLIQLRAHGWAKDLPHDKEQAMAKQHDIIEFNRLFTFYLPGFNVRSTDLNARIGLSQMKKIDFVTKRRMENHHQYQKRFREAGFYCQENLKADICSISFATLAANPNHRSRIGHALQQNGIEHRPLGGGNMSRQPFWKRIYGEQEMPVADRVHTTSIQVPNHPELREEDINFICDIILGVKPRP